MYGASMPLLCGQIETDFSRAQLLRGLIRHGVLPEMRESSHYEEGKYIRIHLDSYMAIERIEDKEFLIRGDAHEPTGLIRDAESLSSALANIRLRHRMEIYNREKNLVGYCHWSWPLDAKAESTTVTQ